MNKPSKKYSILFVDDEKRILNALRSIFRRNYTVYLANGGKEALEILANNDIDVIVSDQRMPNMLGNELLAKVHQLYPKTMRLLLTGFMDKEAIVKTINEGEIYRFINKPWNNQDIVALIADAAKASDFPLEPAQHSTVIKAGELDNTIENPVGVTDHSGSGKPMDHSIVLMGSNQELRNQVRHICRENDFNIYGVKSVPQVVDMISARPTIGVAIIELPTNTDEAIQTISFLKANRPDLISIALTDETDADTAVELINSGQVFRYLTKPLETSQLKHVLSQAFFRHQAMNNDDNIKKRFAVETSKRSLSSNLRDLFSSFSRSSTHA